MFDITVFFTVTLYDGNDLTVKDLYKHNRDNETQFLGEDIDFECLNQIPGIFHVYFTVSDFDMDYMRQFENECDTLLYDMLFAHYQPRTYENNHMNIDITRITTLKRTAIIMDEEIREIYAESKHFKE
jgi:hypothetical protein